VTIIRQWITSNPSRTDGGGIIARSRDNEGAENCVCPPKGRSLPFRGGRGGAMKVATTEEARPALIHFRRFYAETGRDTAAEVDLGHPPSQRRSTASTQRLGLFMNLFREGGRGPIKNRSSGLSRERRGRVNRRSNDRRSRGISCVMDRGARLTYH